MSGPATGELVVDREMLILREISESCLAGLGNSLLDVEVGIRRKVLPQNEDRRTLIFLVHVEMAPGWTRKTQALQACIDKGLDSELEGWLLWAAGGSMARVKCAGEWVPLWGPCSAT